MRRYYFDVRDGDQLAIDEEGYELASIASVLKEAARALAEMARDAVRSPKYEFSKNHLMAIEVRSLAGPVLEVKFTIEVRQAPELIG
jgi:hypothetical protein